MEAEFIMGRQFGVASRAQLIAAGCTARQIGRRCQTGRWERVHRGVYRLAFIPPSWEASLLAACLASDGIVSHRSAAGMLIGDLAQPSIVEISVPRGRHPDLDGVIVHETKQWGLRDPQMYGVLPVTGIDRTLLDCAGVVTARRLERLCESAIRQTKTSWLDLSHTLMRHSRKGRNGCGGLRALLAARVGTEVVPLSDFSRLVVNLLDDHGVESPVVEHRIHDRNGRFIMQADLAWPHRSKACELDGLAHHFGRAERERDNRKRNLAKAEGWNILEVLWSMYLDEPTELVRQIRRFLAA